MDYDVELTKEFVQVVDDMGKTVDPLADQIITAENVFQPAKKVNRKIFQEFLNKLILPESGIKGKENLLEFYKNFKNGKSSLILSEHKSNFDVPGFFTIMNLDSDPVFKEIFESIVFVAGRKLNEEEIFVKLMAEQFNRVIVVPKNETQGASDAELEKAMLINLTTQSFIKNNKQNYIFLVFPTGTRSKPWDRSTYKGIREVFNYVKNFDQVIFLSINGNLMLPKQGSMAKEPPRKDKMEYIFSKPYDTKTLIEKFRTEIKNSDIKDIKQYSIDKIMDYIYQQKGVMPWDEK